MDIIGLRLTEEFYTEQCTSEQTTINHSDPKEVPYVTTWEVEASLRDMKNGRATNACVCVERERGREREGREREIDKERDRERGRYRDEDRQTESQRERMTLHHRHRVYTTQWEV